MSQVYAPINPSSLPTRFTREITEAPRPSKVKIPTLELYDGTTDLEGHLAFYKAQTYFEDVNDATTMATSPPPSKVWRKSSSMASIWGASLAFTN